MSGLLDWQDGAALAVTAAAALYLARRLAGTFRPRAGGCATGCSGCPSGAEATGSARPPLVASPDLVQIGPGPPIQPRPDRSRTTG
jgi:hypothetical protein